MKNQKFVFVNQIGYSPDSVKFGYVRTAGNPCNDTFTLKNKKGLVVYTGKLVKAPDDPLTGEEILQADFSAFTEAGKYVLCVGQNESFEFTIGQNIYGNLFYSILNYFYLSRCGQQIEGGKFGHPACHTGEADIYGTDEKATVLGGWHDAGDYGRYIVAGSKAVMDLLLAYQECKETFKDFDILGEVRFELEWMLQLQRDDGAVYHKISCYHFCSFINPHEEQDRLVIAPVSTSATADFAGCLAYASKFFKDEDPAFAEKLVEAALKAQSYLDTHADEFYKNPQEITTGGYGDWNVNDERFFALCSLFELTGKPEYIKKALEYRQEILDRPEDKEHPWVNKWFEAFGWGCVAGYGTEIIIRNKEKVAAAVGQSVVDEYEKIVVSHADEIVERVNTSGFGVGIRFVQWGSNGQVCDEAHYLLMAYELTGNKTYFDAASRQLDYILGCNPQNLCYVTGNGSNCTKHPHHRPSGAIGATMPGMLAGGPSAGLQDAVAKEFLEGKPALQCYIDKQGSYSTNEVAIYWNSPLVLLIAKLGLV